MSQREKKFNILRRQRETASLAVVAECTDSLVVEEPLEIRVIIGPPELRKTKTLSVTMRTPGNDFELAVGFLVSEGIISRSTDVLGHQFVGPIPDSQDQPNTIEIELHPELKFEFSKLQRHFYTTSSCGVCGKASLDAISADNVFPNRSTLTIDAESIHELPDLLRGEQDIFERTGGLHAAGLLDGNSQLVASREDVGRHNAVDKLIGSQLIAANFPLPSSLLVLSGRASFELLQKSLLASIPIIVAVGAPSSLAVELAREFNLTLVGFTSKNKFNVYSGSDRIRFKNSD